MSSQVTGYDRETISTPFNVRRGSELIVNRTVNLYDPDQSSESAINIAAATAIVWNLLDSTARSVAATLSKTLAASTIALVGGGITGRYTFTIQDFDTKTLVLGLYTAQLSIVIGSNRIKLAPYKVYLLGAGDLGE